MASSPSRVSARSGTSRSTAARTRSSRWRSFWPQTTRPSWAGRTSWRRRMYFVDSAWGEVRVHPFDPATGIMGGGRPLVRFPNDGSVPDGLTVDAEGHLWVALWGAGCVVRIAPDGSIAGRVDLPVSQVSSCTFGGGDLGDLYTWATSTSPPRLRLQRRGPGPGAARGRPLPLPPRRARPARGPVLRRRPDGKPN